MLATITAAFFRLFVWHKALGKPTQELAQPGLFTAEELEELKWRYPKQYDRYSARAMQMVRHERAARCSANVETRFATAEAKDLPHLARALEILARMQLLKGPSAKRATRQLPKEAMEWVEMEVEEQPEASAEENAPEKVTREDYEQAVFHSELQKKLAQHPEVYQAVIDEVLKHDEQHAPEAKPEPPQPATVQKSSFTGLLLFVASWFGLAHHTQLPPFS